VTDPGQCDESRENEEEEAKSYKTSFGVLKQRAGHPEELRTVHFLLIISKDHSS